MSCHFCEDLDKSIFAKTNNFFPVQRKFARKKSHFRKIEQYGARPFVLHVGCKYCLFFIITFRKSQNFIVIAQVFFNLAKFSFIFESNFCQMRKQNFSFLPCLPVEKGASFLHLESSWGAELSSMLFIFSLFWPFMLVGKPRSPSWHNMTFGLAVPLVAHQS